MIFLSILAKALGLAMVQAHPLAAALCWLAGLVPDAVVVRRAAAGPPRGAMVRGLVWFHLAALVTGWGACAGCDYAAMRWKEGIPALAHPLGWLLNLCGVPAGVNGGTVVLTTMAGALEFAVSIDFLALRLPLLVLVVGAVWLAGQEVTPGAVWRKLGSLATILLVVTLVRAVLWVLLFLGLTDFTGYESEELPFRPFMGETVSALAHLPFLLAAGFLFGRVLAVMPEDARREAAAVPRVPPVLRWGTVAALLLWWGILEWEPAGTPKNGKVVFSSWHAQWSRLDRPYDRDWYGADSGYNYACLKRLFSEFWPVAEAAGRLRASDLEGAGVLVIHDPDRRFDAGEIELVNEFVHKGGGLLLIGDHTNVFGSSTHLNEVCEAFGFRYRDDVLFDLDADFHQVIDRPAVASRFWHGMEFFKLRGPTSIRPTSLATRSVYQVGHSKSVRAIFSVNNFYPPPHDNPRMKTGNFCVAAAARHGSGRVAAWGDSTVFSNFEIFYPGKYEYLLNTVDWLNRRDNVMLGPGRRVAALLGAAGLVWLLGRRPDPRWWRFTAAAAVATLLAARAASSWVECRRAAFPQPVQPAEWVMFAARSDDPGHNLRGFVSEEPFDQRYDVFIQWVLRTGAYPAFYLLDKPQPRGLYGHLRGGGVAQPALALIVRKPEDLVQVDELAGVAAGDRNPLLLMFASGVTAEQAVERMRGSGIVGDAAALAQVAAAWPAGEAAVDDAGRRVLVVAGAERFSDQAMGLSEKVVPTPAQRGLFDQAFGVIDRLFGRQAVPAPSSPAPPPAATE